MINFFIVLGLIGCVSHAKIGSKKLSIEAVAKHEKSFTQTVSKKISTIKNTESLFNQVRKKYSSYKLVEMEANRLVYIKLLKRERSTDLKIYISSKGYLRIETKTQPVSITLLSDDKAMVIDEPDEVFGGPVRVLVSKDSAIKDSQAFLRIIFGIQNLKPYYKIDKEIKDTVYLKSIHKNMLAKYVSVKMDRDNLQIKEISYEDESKNKITIKIKSSSFKKKENKELFKYKIPKNAEITEV